MGQEVQILCQSIQDMRSHMNKTLSDTLSAINLVREQSLQEILSLQKQVTGNVNRLEDISSRVRLLEEEQ
jgi:tRNA uridine 5-carbamoylmethylation protein Kti12